ncbi:protein of unknown function [Burkholderia multivorans]
MRKTAPQFRRPCHDFVLMIYKLMSFGAISLSGKHLTGLSLF